MKYYDSTGYKYTTADANEVFLPAFHGDAFRGRLFSLEAGVLRIAAGYSWDGASGPTWDTPATMLPSLVHDVLYQAIRSGLLPVERRFDADIEFYRLMRERTRGAAGHLRAFYFFVGVRLFGWISVRPNPAGEAQDTVINAR